MRRLAALALLFLAACAPLPEPSEGEDAALAALVGRAHLLHASRLDAYAASLARQRPTAVVRDLPFDARRPEVWGRVVIYDFGVSRDAAQNLIRENLPRGPGVSAAGRFGHAGATLEVTSLAWDHMLIRWPGADRPDEVLAGFAARWQADGLRGQVHSLLPSRGGVLIDFGSAPPEAFFDLVERLAAAGITRIAVSAG